MTYISKMNILTRNTASSKVLLNSFVFSKRLNNGIANQNTELKSLRSEVFDLYKNLIYLSREWPTDLRPQIKSAFIKNKDKTDVNEIRELIGRGEYVCREIIATYNLRKYRTMRRRYYSGEDNKHLEELFKSFNKL